MHTDFISRRWLTLLLLLTCLLQVFAAPAAASGDVPGLVTCTFGGDCPQVLRQLLDENGHRDTAVISGAAMLNEGEPSKWNAAVLIAQGEGSRFLLALQWRGDGFAVVTERYAMQGIDLAAVTGVEPVVDGAELYRRLFVLHFTDGSALELFGGFGSRWRVYGYLSPEGEHITLLAGELCLNGEYMPVPYEAWLGNPMAAAGFPRSEREARQLAESAWQAVLTDGRAMINGANLREEPTASSRSFGKYINALGEVLEQQPGKNEPWYRVRIGETEGWVSGPYVTFPEEGVRYALRYGSEYAVAVQETLLLRKPGSGDTVRRLAAGTPMQVLADTGKGWLHVLVTEGGLTLRPEAKGVYGYISADAVVWTKKDPLAPEE